jgi:periplasmic protein TonB
VTAATSGPSGPNIFSMFSSEREGLYRTKSESFVFSLVGQAVMLAIVIYFTRCVIVSGPEIARNLHQFKEFPLVFSGHNGGGGGNHDSLPASWGNLSPAALEQLAPPTVMHPTAMPKLAVPETVVVAPEVKLPQGGQIGDPSSQFVQALSDGHVGLGGVGNDGCCGGVGDHAGPGFGDGPSGIYPAGKAGVTVPQVIYNPEPGFSDEARKAKQQGLVMLILVVGKDGKTYDIHVRQSLGMGLDEKAVEAVTRWRFRPATLNGQPVATQIAVEVNFRLY